MEVQVNVIGQKLKIATNCKTFVEGTRNFIKFVFALPDEWVGLDVHAQFVQDGNAFNAQLDSNYCVFLPYEIHDGLCELILYGESDITMAVTDGVMLNIKRSNHTSDGIDQIYVFATLEEMKEYLQIY